MHMRTNPAPVCLEHGWLVHAHGIKSWLIVFGFIFGLL
ncbi:MAG: hypothetical protein JETT_0814 [Candidatus Jettenia ecosi]|uniref:Uncharacterized protein n=1 Tax=Candidatus Jettenia ecosi TaxID=2494326 RepID=A0A533QE10_9BACT|nr:MAG: hypothetical protein JETT_0814 [Candidatus Jettenia ecosi]